ncbi:MAG: hypothetical protein ACK53F_03720, partial [Betaproteobacteria bacterium]
SFFVLLFLYFFFCTSFFVLLFLYFFFCTSFFVLISLLVFVLPAARRLLNSARWATAVWLGSQFNPYSAACIELHRARGSSNLAP